MDGVTVGSDWGHLLGWAGTVVSVLVGAAVTLFTQLLVARYKIRREADTEQLRLYYTESQRVRQDLMGELLDLRQHVLKLQESNLNYVRENAELRQQVAILIHENGELKARVVELEGRVQRMSGGAAVTNKIPVAPPSVTEGPND